MGNITFNQFEIISQMRREQWLAENKEAFEAYNRRIGTGETLSDGLKRFRWSGLTFTSIPTG